MENSSPALTNTDRLSDLVWDTIRNAALEEAAKACEAEANMPSIASPWTAFDCAEAIRALKTTRR